MGAIQKLSHFKACKILVLPCTARQILNHWTTREVLQLYLNYNFLRRPMGLKLQCTSKLLGELAKSTAFWPALRVSDSVSLG